MRNKIQLHKYRICIKCYRFDGYIFYVISAQSNCVDWEVEKLTALLFCLMLFIRIYPNLQPRKLWSTQKHHKAMHMDKRPRFVDGPLSRRWQIALMLMPNTIKCTSRPIQYRMFLCNRKKNVKINWNIDYKSSRTIQIEIGIWIQFSLTVMLWAHWCRIEQPLAIDNSLIPRQPSLMSPTIVLPLLWAMHKMPSIQVHRYRRYRRNELFRSANCGIKAQKKNRIISSFWVDFHIMMSKIELFVRTNNKNEPNVKQNTNGPARSVSCKIVCSVVRNGFNTDIVCKQRKKNLIV